MSKSLTPKPFLSKSTFIRGLQCEKSLYLHKKRPFLRDKLSPEQRAKFSRGLDVGLFAQQLYPGGVDASPQSHFQIAAAVKKTAELIAGGQEIIYEAAFQYMGVRVALDILVKENGQWKAVEVKSSKAISDTYLWDASLQYFVITGAGIRLNDFHIAYMNDNFIRKGAIDIHLLFHSESVFDEILKRQPEVEKKVESLREVSGLKSSPDIPIGTHCRNPYPCDFIGHCWKKVPDGSVFQLKALDETKKFEYFHQGIQTAEALPEELIHEENLRLQIQSIKEKRVITKPSSLKEYHGIFEKPHAFVSSLSFSPAIPPFDNVKPYQPLAFSLGVKAGDQGQDPPKFFMAVPGAPMPLDVIRGFFDSLEGFEQIMVFDGAKELKAWKQMISGDNHLAGKLDTLSEKLFDIGLPFRDYRIFWAHMSECHSPETILKSMGFNARAANGRVKSPLEAALLFAKLTPETEEEANANHLKDIKEYHYNELSFLREMAGVLKELSANSM